MSTTADASAHLDDPRPEPPLAVVQKVVPQYPTAGEDEATGDEAVVLDDAAKAAYLRRLRRIEGQVRGLQRMVETDRPCMDVLTQISAVTHALQAVSVGLLQAHVGSCVVNAARRGSEEEARRRIEEMTATLTRLLRS